MYLDKDFNSFVKELKQKILLSQKQAIKAVNYELVLLYWDIGNSIILNQKQQGWGAKIVENLSSELKKSFPNMSGFSSRNLKYMRQFADTYQDKTFVQEVLAQLSWYNNLTIMQKLKMKAKEKDIEAQLVKHITEFLLELGVGFAFVGKQYKIEVANKDYFIDLLFYHLKLRCYFVIELKSVAFKPEFTGKLNFYLSAVDDILKTENDNPTIGLILCKEKDKIEAEYALRDINKPIGISEYQITKSLPNELKSKLPTIEDIEEILDND